MEFQFKEVKMNIQSARSFSDLDSEQKNNRFVRNLLVNVFFVCILFFLNSAVFAVLGSGDKIGGAPPGIPKLKMEVNMEVSRDEMRRKAAEAAEKRKAVAKAATTGAAAGNSSEATAVGGGGETPRRLATTEQKGKRKLTQAEVEANKAADADVDAAEAAAAVNGLHEELIKYDRGGYGPAAAAAAAPPPVLNLFSDWTERDFDKELRKYTTGGRGHRDVEIGRLKNLQIASEQEMEEHGRMHYNTVPKNYKVPTDLRVLAKRVNLLVLNMIDYSIKFNLDDANRSNVPSLAALAGDKARAAGRIHANLPLAIKVESIRILMKDRRILEVYETFLMALDRYYKDPQKGLPSILHTLLGNDDSIDLGVAILRALDPADVRALLAPPHGYPITSRFGVFRNVDLDLIRLLIGAGIDINNREWDAGRTLYFMQYLIACTSGSEEELNTLLELAKLGARIELSSLYRVAADVLNHPGYDNCLNFFFRNGLTLRSMLGSQPERELAILLLRFFMTVDYMGLGRAERFIDAIISQAAIEGIDMKKVFTQNVTGNKSLYEYVKSKSLRDSILRSTEHNKEKMMMQIKEYHYGHELPKFLPRDPALRQGMLDDIENADPGRVEQVANLFINRLLDKMQICGVDANYYRPFHERVLGGILDLGSRLTGLDDYDPDYGHDSEEKGAVHVPVVKKHAEEEEKEGEEKRGRKRKGEEKEEDDPEEPGPSGHKPS